MSVENQESYCIVHASNGCLSSRRLTLEYSGWLTIYQTWNLPVGYFEDFLLTLFEKYAELLKKRFRDDFQEVSP
jgi:hypothetical protein